MRIWKGEYEHEKNGDRVQIRSSFIVLGNIRDRRSGDRTREHGHINHIVRSRHCAVFSGVHQMTEPFINKELIAKIRQARERTFDADIAFDDTVEEERHMSELYRIMQNYDSKELAVCIAAALDKEPRIVYQVLAEDREELIKSVRKGRNNESN